MRDESAEREDHDDASSGRAPAVTRAVQILLYLVRHPEPIGVNPLASALGIVPSTCLHILRALHQEGLVAVDPQTKRYRLGLGVLALARAFLSRSPIPYVVQPLLDTIARRSGATAALIERLGVGKLIVSAVAEGADMFSVKVTVGTTFPEFSSATGRCMAAYSNLDKATLRKRFDQLRWQNGPTFERWLREVKDAATRGFAIDSGNYIKGLTVISAPIPDSGGGVSRALAVVAVKEQLSDERRSKLITEVQSAARELQNAAW